MLPRHQPHTLRFPPLTAALRLLTLAAAAALAAATYPARADTPDTPTTTQAAASLHPHDEVAALTRAGQPAQAIHQADTYLATHPRDPQMRFLRGMAQSRAGDVQGAIATFTLLTQEYPELPEPYNNLAVLHASQGELERARAALETAVRNHPGYAVALENLGDIHARLAHDAWLRAQQLRTRQTPANANATSTSGGRTALALKLAGIERLLQPQPAP